jgi:hypothetical protein
VLKMHVIEIYLAIKQMFLSECSRNCVLCMSVDGKSFVSLVHNRVVMNWCCVVH